VRIQGKHYHTIWQSDENESIIQVIDQRKLPFQFEIFDIYTVADVCFAIKEMVVRGAPLIGVTAAYGMYLALFEYKAGDFEKFIGEKALLIKATRPTAVNLAFAVDRMVDFILKNNDDKYLNEKTLQKVEEFKQLEIINCEKIGDFGVGIIEEIYRQKKGTVNILTHCNAGWLACIDWGTATAPLYKAHLKGIPIHVWVDETRPRNQGARLTAFELGEEGIPHTIIPDNTGGHLMQHGMVDLVIVGSDRTTATGDVANKIGTYLKALAASDNDIPFYVALPSTTFDWKMTDGIKEIPIEQRDPKEVTDMEGWTESGVKTVRITPERSNVANYGFDVTPARLITGLITERGICEANKYSIVKMFPEND